MMLIKRLQLVLGSNWAILAGILFLVLLAYLGVWDFGFVYDDYGHLVDNKVIHSLQPLTKFFNYPGIINGGVTASVWRPLSAFAAALSWQIFGDNPAGHHVANFILHIVNVGLVYFVILALSYKKSIAAPVALIFGVHPALIEAVTWIASQNTLLFSLFFLSSLFLAIKNKLSPLSWAFFFLALLSKETAIVGPVIFFLIHLFKTQGERIDFKKALFKTAPYIAVETIYFILRFIFVPLPDGIASSLLIIPVVFTVYLRSIFWPTNLVILDAVPVSEFLPKTVFDARVILGAIILIALIGAAVFFWRKKWWEELVGVAWFLAFWAPTSQIIPIEGILGTRVLYLPFIGIVLLIFSLLYRFVGRALFKKFIVPVVVALALLLSFLTFKNNRHWESQESFWLNVVKSYPYSGDATSGLLAYYLSISSDNQKNGPIVELPQIAKTNPFLRIISGQALPGDYELAEKRFIEILKSDPSDRVALNNLGILYKMQKINSGIVGMVHAAAPSTIEIYIVENGNPRLFIITETEPDNRLRIYLRPDTYQVKAGDWLSSPFYLQPNAWVEFKI